MKQSESHQPIFNDDVLLFSKEGVTVVLIGAHWTIPPKLFFSSTNWQILPKASLSGDKSLQNDPSGLVHDLCGCVTVQFLCCAFVRDGLRGWEQGLPRFSAAHLLLTTGSTSTEELCWWKHCWKSCVWWDVKLKRTWTRKAFTLSSSGATETKKPELLMNRQRGMSKTGPMNTWKQKTAKNATTFTNKL